MVPVFVPRCPSVHPLFWKIFHSYLATHISLNGTRMRRVVLTLWRPEQEASSFPKSDGGKDLGASRRVRWMAELCRSLASLSIDGKWLRASQAPLTASSPWAVHSSLAWGGLARGMPSHRCDTPRNAHPERSKNDPMLSKRVKRTIFFSEHLSKHRTNMGGSIFNLLRFTFHREAEWGWAQGA